jgi:hypothetical protein
MATVDDVLGRMHRQAAGLRPGGSPERKLQEQLAGWIPLAANSRRVLESLDPRPGEHPDLYGALESLARPRRVSAGRPDPDLEALARTVGALGDILDSFPKAVATAGQAQRSMLQASIQAALYAAARSTLSCAAGTEPAGMLISKVAEATEFAALLPPRARESILEGLTVTRLTAESVDGAVRLWLKAAEGTLTNYQLFTGIALQEAAATLSLLSRISADTLREAARRQIIDAGSARQAAGLMDGAAAAWRKASAWPSSVQLGGRAPEHHLAVHSVREALSGPQFTRLTLREKVHLLRSAAIAAATIGQLQAGAVLWVVDSGGLWVGQPRPNLRPPGVQRRQVKFDWEPMSPDHPFGVLLAERAYTARKAQQAATEAIDEAIRPAIIGSEPGDLGLVDNRITAGRWERIGVAARTRKPEDGAWPLTSHQRPPVTR